MREFLVTAFMVGVGCIAITWYLVRKAQRFCRAGGYFDPAAPMPARAPRGGRGDR